MCAIAGIFAYSASARPVDRAELVAIRDHMAARGPDGAGVWYSDDNRLGLAHRRLAIIDLSDRGAQPMISADGRYQITFNGEIYNYRELKRSLEGEGRVFASDSDTEVLLHLFAIKGQAMLPELRGMFAFAIWDALEKSLFIARDAFGIKPLYYADDGKSFRFASQVKALLKGPVDRSPEPAGHVGFYLWGAVPEPWTLYRGIRSLPAGHFLFISAAQSTLKQWTSVHNIIRDSSQLEVTGSRQDALHDIAAAVHRSVKAHMVADVPVGVFLSAGLDSCMLASAAKENAAAVHAVTLGFREFEGSLNDEVPLARQIAEKFALQHDVFAVARADFVAQRVALLAAMDQPSIDGVNTWFVSNAAQKADLKVVLSGLGGDELFASYPSFTDVPRMHGLLRPFAKVPALGRALRIALAPFASRLTSPKLASVFEYGGTLGGAYFLRRGLMMPWEITDVLDRDLVAEGLERLQITRNLDLLVQGLPLDRLRVSSLEMGVYMRHQLLRDSDWASMAHSLELRVPFVDTHLLREVVPWLARFPDITKAEVAQAVAPAAPKEIWSRPKTGFGIPVREWLLADIPNERARGVRGWAHRVFRIQIAADPVTQSELAFSAWHPKARTHSTESVRVLISSIAPGPGGVNAMVQFALGTLRSEGFEPVIAHYEPYSVYPQLSVPSFSLLSRRVGKEIRTTHDGIETHAMGCWLPEMEFTNYSPTNDWREVMDSCQGFVVASGNALAATPFQKTKRPYLSWIATDWAGDRADRVSRFSLGRRLLDKCVNSPTIRRLERRLLESGETLALSRHTQKELIRIFPNLKSRILPVPVDSIRFVPRCDATVVGRIGFAGRFDDPRKNVDLLLMAFGRLSATRPDATLLLMGGANVGTIESRLKDHRIVGGVQICERLSDCAYLDALQSLDVFLVPSYQEGLCIAALEAMACGVPVVSTRCGGPEEFVEDGVTGYLCEFDATDLADKAFRIIADRDLRARLSRGARTVAEQRYNPKHARAVFLEGFYSAFPKLRRAGDTARMEATLKPQGQP